MAADQADTLKPQRWYRLTPGRVVAGLLPLEGLLWLSGRYHWFAFNQHKGWTVLITLGAVLLAALVMFVWFLAAVLFRGRFQFSIRSLLLLTVVVALPCSWFSWEMKKASEQKEAVRTLQELFPMVRYDYEYDAAGKRAPGAQRPGSPWVRRFTGDDFFADAVSLYFLSASQVTDAGLEHLGGLGQLRYLELRLTRVTDAGLEHLKGLSHLQILGLGRTRVTDAGLEHLKGLGQLHVLNLDYTRVTGAGLEHLKGLGQLHLLNLDYTRVTDAGLEHLKGLGQLQWLTLKGTNVTDAGLEHLKGLSQLRSLRLGGTQVADAGVKKFQQALPNCEIER